MKMGSLFCHLISSNLLSSFVTVKLVLYNVARENLLAHIQVKYNISAKTQQ